MMLPVRTFACAVALGAIGTPALAEDVEFLLINRGSQALAEFYAAPANGGVFDENVLGADLLAPDERAVITIADGGDACLYDFNFVFENGDEVTRRNVDLCEVDTYTITD